MSAIDDCQNLDESYGEICVRLNIDRFPCFHVTGSIAGMKKMFYGKNALLVRCGSWIYNVSKEPRIYYKAH